MNTTDIMPPVAQKSRLHAARSELVRVTLANAAITGLNIVTGLLVARHLAVDDYGRLSYFINIFGLLRLLASLGMTSQITFEIARARGLGEPIKNRFYSLLMVRALSLIGITFLTIGLGYLRHDSLLMIAGLASTLALINDFGVGALQGLDLIPQVISVLALQPVLYSLGLAVIIVHHLPLAAIYFAFTFSFIFAILLAGIWLARKLGFAVSTIIGLRGLLSSLHYAGGMYLLGIAGTLFTSYATLYLGWMGRFVDTALITIPLNIVFMPGTLANAAMTIVYFPRLSTLHAERDEASARSLFMLFYELASAATMLIAIVLFMYPHAMLSLFYGARYQDSAPLLAFMAPVTYLYTMQTVLTSSIAAQGRIRASLYGALGSTAVLLVAITLVSSMPGNLTWIALVHSLAAGLGLVWQWWLVSYPVQKSLVQIGKQLVAAVALNGVGRLVVPDSPDRIAATMVVLVLATMIYSGWIWRHTGMVA